MDEFNMSMPGEPQIGLPGNHVVDRIKQEAGIEMQITPLAAFGIGAGTSLLGGFFGRKSARSARRREEEYLDRLLAYQNLNWDMNKSLTIAKRAETIRAIDLRKANEAKFAAFRDANNQQAHNFALQIWRHQET